MRNSQTLRKSIPHLDSLPCLLQSCSTLSRSHHIKVASDGLHNHGHVSGIGTVDSNMGEEIVRVDAEGLELMSRSYAVQDDELVVHVEAEDCGQDLGEDLRGGTGLGTVRSEAGLRQLPKHRDCSPHPRDTVRGAWRDRHRRALPTRSARQLW